MELRNPDSLCKSRESERWATNYASSGYQVALLALKIIFPLQNSTKQMTTKRKKKNVDETRVVNLVYFQSSSVLFQIRQRTIVQEKCSRKNKNCLNLLQVFKVIK